MATVETPGRAEFEAQLSSVADLAYRVARGLTRNADDAMDLVQDATIQAYRAFGNFEPGSNFRAWFLRILTNRFLKLRRKKTADTVPIDDAEDLFLYKQSKERGDHGNDSDPAGLVMDKLDVEAVEDALDRLPDDFRTTAVLYFMENLSYEEIAQAVDVPVCTVRSRLHRARKLLQKALWAVAEARGLTKQEAAP
jgi:RNA polymerase sigma-70 factor, ECF subfamily